MANKKISDLTAIDALAAGDTIPVDDLSASNTTKKATITQVLAAIPAASGSVPGTMSAVDKAKLDAATQNATPSTLVIRDSSGDIGVHNLNAVNVTATGLVTAPQVTILNVPANATDAATKSYVDAGRGGLTVKAPVTLATTSPVTLSGGAPNSVDAIFVNVGDRILVKNQTVAAQNGIYVVVTVGTGFNGTWTRALDSDSSNELPTGSYVFVQLGATLANSSWVMNTTGTIVLDTTPLVWALYSAITDVPTSALVGQIVNAQIADAALNVAKFAAGLRPVELVDTMPTTGNSLGRLVFLKTVDGSFAANKLYRWTSSGVTTGTSFWTAAVPAVDITGNLTDAQIADLSATKLTGQITSVQITDNAISAPKISAGAVIAGKLAVDAVVASNIQAGAVIAGKINAGAVLAGCLAANSVIAGTVQAGAINTNELAALAVRADKIAVGTITATQIAGTSITGDRLAIGTITGDRIGSTTITGSNIATGTITADRMTVTSLSSIVANLGTITAGTISIGSGLGQVNISTSGLIIGSTGKISLAGDGANPWIRVFGGGSYSGHYIQMNGDHGGVAPYFQASDGFGSSFAAGSLGMSLGNGKNFIINSGSTILGPGDLYLQPGGSALNIVTAESPFGGTPSGYVQMKVNGRTIQWQFELP